MATSASAGRLLRQAREAAGLHIAALAVLLKVPVRKIEALEADRWGDLPDSAYVRPLAASVCRALRVDPKPVLALLPAPMPTRLRDAESLGGANIGDAGQSIWSRGYRQLARAPGIALLLLLAAAIVYLWPPSEPAPLRPDSKSSATGEAVLAPGGAPAASEQLGTSSVTSASLPVAAVEPSASTASAATAPAAAAVAPAGSLQIMFRARSNTWIEVVDGRQAVLLRRTLSSGESAIAEGVPPLTVVVGRANVTEVLVRGRPIDVVAQSKDNVARFEVK